MCLVTAGMVEIKRFRGKERKKTLGGLTKWLGGLTKWLCVGRATVALKVMRDRDGRPR